MPIYCGLVPTISFALLALTRTLEVGLLLGLVYNTTFRLYDDLH